MDGTSIRMYDDYGDEFIIYANDDYEIPYKGNGAMILSPLEDSELYGRMSIHYGFSWLMAGIRPSIIVRFFCNNHTCVIEVGDGETSIATLRHYETIG